MTSFAVNTACASRNPSPGSALAGGFLVRLALLLSIFSAPALHAIAAGSNEAAACHTSHYDEKATIKHVIDGDTVILADDRHIRLIGIDTPEIRHDDKPAQAGADEAYNYLNNLLRTQKSVYLHYDKERFDQYGRTLAHLFLVDGTNLQSLLLRRGLATTFTIPPNLEFLDCYESSTGFAQGRGIGLWALRQYQPTPAAAITREDLGYRIITGSVMRTGKSKSSFWINLAQNLSLRIAGKDLQYFGNLQELAGKQIRARGRLYYSNGEFRMQIRHPVDLHIIDLHSQN